jgi:hypothetical protein
MAWLVISYCSSEWGTRQFPALCFHTKWKLGNFSSNYKPIIVRWNCKYRLLIFCILQIKDLYSSKNVKMVVPLHIQVYKFGLQYKGNKINQYLILRRWNVLRLCITLEMFKDDAITNGIDFQILLPYPMSTTHKMNYVRTCT